MSSYITSLLARIKSMIVVCDKTGCWLFQGTTWNGYGRISVRGRMWPAHHAAYYATTGKLPPAHKKFVWLHDCDIRACCNPEHGEWNTVLRNNQDRHAKGRTVLPSPEAAALGRARAAATRAAKRRSPECQAVR